MTAHQSIHTTETTVINNFERSYFSLLRQILEHGEIMEGRNGRTKYIFGSSITHDLREGFPILTSRKMAFSLAVEEFLWDISGSRNVSDLKKAKAFWQPWTDTVGNLSTSYGVFLRNFPRIHSRDSLAYADEVVGSAEVPLDQLKLVHRELIHNPTSRRLVISMYHPGFAFDGEVMPACHPTLVFSSDGYHLDLLVLGRSNDMAVGFPWDIQRYSLLTTAMAQDAGLQPRFVQFTNANAHLYENCWDPVARLLERTPSDVLPTLSIEPKSLFSLTQGDFSLQGYNAQDSLKFPFNE